MYRPSRLFTAAVLLTVSLIPASAKTRLRLGVTQGTQKGFIEGEMAPLLRHLNTSPDYSFELAVLHNHNDLYAAFRSGTIDLAFLGAVKYLQAHAELGAVPLAAEGATARTSIVVPRSSTITQVSQLKGKRFAFGYEDSTTTHLIPLLILSKYGIHKDDIKYAFVGHQPQQLLDEMLAGKFDACPVSDFMYQKNKSRLRVLEKSDPFPGPPITARKTLDAASVAAVRQLLVSYKAAPGDEEHHFGKGATPVTDADYNKIRFLVKVLFKKDYR